MTLYIVYVNFLNSYDHFPNLDCIINQFTENDKQMSFVKLSYDRRNHVVFFNTCGLIQNLWHPQVPPYLIKIILNKPQFSSANASILLLYSNPKGPLSTTHFRDVIFICKYSIVRCQQQTDNTSEPRIKCLIMGFTSNNQNQNNWT